MTMPTLYNYDLNEDCYRVRLVAACIGCRLDLMAVDEYPGKEHLSPELLAINPAGRLPILTDGALTLTETGAILLYLAQAHDRERRFIPSDPTAYARMMDWLMFLVRDLGMAAVARGHAMQGDDLRAAPAIRAARHALRLMEDHMTRAGLQGQGCFAGDTLTLADLALFPAFALSRDFNVDHDEFPALRLWARRVRQVKGFITMPGIPDYH